MLNLLQQISDAPPLDESDLVKSIFTVPDGKMRGVLMLSDKELKETYLQPNGFQLLVNGMSDEDLQKIASDDTNFRISGKTFDLDFVKELKQDNRFHAVLLDIDEDLVERMASASFESLDDARDFLREFFDHQFYLTTLNASSIIIENGSRVRFKDKFIESFVPPKSILAAVAVPALQPALVNLIEQTIPAHSINTEVLIQLESLIKKSIHVEKRATKWTFTVKRDSSGLIETIDAVANNN